VSTSMGLARSFYSILHRIRYRQGKAWKVNGSETFLFSGKIRYVSEIHWPEIWTPLMAAIRPDDLCVDCGAGTGIFSLGMAKRLSGKGKLVAIEPDPWNASLLEENLRLNRLEAAYDVLQCAVTDRAGTIEFNAKGDPLSCTGKSSESKPVNTVSLDGLFPTEKIGVMTITVMGCEWELLQGAKQIFEDPLRRPRAVYIALEPPIWEQLGKQMDMDRIVEFFEHAGYDVTETRRMMTNKGRLFFPSLLFAH
jgi:FkbM family methyltransferase